MTFVIRHKPTGDLFPCIIGRGQTFIDFMPPWKKAPRLWTKRKDAQGFLTLWCKGPLCATYEETEEETTFPLKNTSSTFKGWKGDPSMASTPRILADYEVVEAHVTLMDITAS